MANEAVCIETPTKFRRVTIAAGAVLPFGTVLKLTDPNTGAASSADNDVFGGIVWGKESTATDTFTELTVAVNGVWDMKDSGSGFTAGAIVNVGGANLVIGSAAADLLTGSVVGKAMETASAAEVVRIEVGSVI